MSATLSSLGGILFLIAFVPYIRAILRGETRPAKASWMIWFALDIIVAVGMFVSHTFSGLIVGATLGAGVVMILALFKGTSGWTRIDKVCLGGTVLSIVLWWLFKNPAVGIATAVFPTLLGAVPTLMSAWEDPKRENRTAWTIFWIGAAFGVFGISSLTIEAAAAPLTFFAIETSVMSVLIVRGRAFART